MGQTFKRFIPKTIGKMGKKVKAAQKKMADHMVQTSVSGYFEQMRKSSSIIDLVDDKPQGK